MREWLRRNNGWILLRKSQREGFRRAWRRWRLWRRVLETAPVPTPLTGTIEVRTICYFFDYLCAIWCLKSFFRAAGRTFPLSIQIQGNAPARVARTLRHHFPNARIITQEAADRQVEAHLEAHGWQRLLAGRRANQYLYKLTDHVILSGFPRVISLDSDLLFFHKPVELLGFTGRHIFQQDIRSTYLVEEAAGVRVAPRLNVGLMNFEPAAISLARCEAYLADFPAYQGWLDQTLYALHAGETGTGLVLPPKYLISLEGGIDPDQLVVRHYAGPSRALMTEEGMPWLAKRGFLER